MLILMVLIYQVYYNNLPVETVLEIKGAWTQLDISLTKCEDKKINGSFLNYKFILIIFVQSNLFPITVLAPLLSFLRIWFADSANWR